jgi:hypothetical protein
MKRVLLSGVTAFTILASSASALTLYTDEKTGQVFTQPGEGRVKMGDFVQKGEKSSSVKKDENRFKLDDSITILNQKSPNFLLGKETHINMKFVPYDDRDMWLKAGVRIQGTFEKSDVDYADPTKENITDYDAYLRRVRFEVAAGFGKHTSFVMDIRNDKANMDDKGEGNFNVGDAYVKIKKPFNNSLVNFKLYRAKIDVSRTETIKSARTIFYDRPQVADEAAQYITHNRRGTNAQMYGDWEKKIHYQVAFGDGVHSGKFKDASGSSFPGGSINQKSFFYGGKLLLSPFDGWEEKSKTETYFGVGKHFSFGAGYWMSPSIEYDDGTVEQSIDHKLLNLELSAHYKNLLIQGEYFKFDGVIKDWTQNEIGKSNGWYALSEYVIPELAYIAPFVRYEKWDKFEDANGYDLISSIGGINWYLRGNTTKFGLSYTLDRYGTNIGNKKEQKIKVTSQWFF